MNILTVIFEVFLIMFSVMEPAYIYESIKKEDWNEQISP